MTPVTHTQKQAALEAVLASQAFARTQQLKDFLRYVCQEEMAGRGDALTEYQIGIEALGRRKDFSPLEDTIVRNRAYALRQRLDEYYRGEGQTDPVRIDLPRGSYAPRYASVPVPVPIPIDAQPAAAKADTTALATLTAALPVPASAASAAPVEPVAWRRSAASPWLIALASGIAGLVLGGSIAWQYMKADVLTATNTNAPGASIGAASDRYWGPLVQRDANAVVAVVAPAHAMLRPVEGPAPTRMWPPVPELERWFRETSRLPVSERARVHLYPYWNAPLWGDAVAASRVIGMLSRAGTSYEMQPERVMSLHALRGRNAVLVGNPEFSAIIGHFLDAAAYTIRYDPSQREWGIVPAASNAQGHRLFSGGGSGGASSSGGEYSVYGLITVLPSDGTEGAAARTVILSGLGSAGTQAAAEFFTSERSLAALDSHLKIDVKSDGTARTPRAYQVIVGSTSQSGLPLTVRYYSHHILDR
jgi:hypothetical protein